MLDRGRLAAALLLPGPAAAAAPWAASPSAAAAAAAATDSSDLGQCVVGWQEVQQSPAKHSWPQAHTKVHRMFLVCDRYYIELDYMLAEHSPVPSCTLYAVVLIP
jgi:hypothetical protein